MKTMGLTLTKEHKEFFAGTGQTGGQTRAKNLSQTATGNRGQGVEGCCQGSRATSNGTEQSQVTESSVSV